jgi:hypothetical protein
MLHQALLGWLNYAGDLLQVGTTLVAATGLIRRQRRTGRHQAKRLKRQRACQESDQVGNLSDQQMPGPAGPAVGVGQRLPLTTSRSRHTGAESGAPLGGPNCRVRADAGPGLTNVKIANSVLDGLHGDIDGDDRQSAPLVPGRDYRELFVRRAN